MHGWELVHGQPQDIFVVTVCARACARNVCRVTNEKQFEPLRRQTQCRSVCFQQPARSQAAQKLQAPASVVPISPVRKRFCGLKFTSQHHYALQMCTSVLIPGSPRAAMRSARRRSPPLHHVRRIGPTPKGVLLARENATDSKRALRLICRCYFFAHTSYESTTS
jgi:hypothetical protein